MTQAQQEDNALGWDISVVLFYLSSHILQIKLLINAQSK